jgi:cysteine-rich repeat protein
MHMLLAVAIALTGARPEGAPQHPPLVAPAVATPVVGEFDRDGDRLDDALAARVSTLSPVAAVRVELAFRRPVTQRQLDLFVRAGGELEWVFQSVAHGFIGQLPAGAVRKLPLLFGADSLLLVKGDDPMQLDLDRATRNARARGVWAPGFGGSVSGFNGSPSTTIAIIDTGLDDSHPDLVGRMAYWKDFQGTSSTPVDTEGHGSCVASIALGSGAAFEAAFPQVRFTRSASFVGFGPNLVSGRAPLSFDPVPITVSATGVFDGAEPAKVALSYATAPVAGARTYTSSATQTGPSPVVLSTLFTPTADRVYSVGLSQSMNSAITWGTVSVGISPYPRVDARPTFRGLAPACKWASFHAADNVMNVEMALDDLMTQREALGIKVVNLSQSPDTAGPTLLPAKITALVQGGVVVVKTAGNNGRSMTNPFITPSGLVALEITVGATSSTNQLTSYTSTGTNTVKAGEDRKPDLLAPGGSLLAVDMLCVDSNDGDSPDGGMPDLTPDDYAPEEGTSFSAPIVTGAAALVIEALESQGLVWSWASAANPKRVKAILLATSSETNQLREAPPSLNPGLGRALGQKDLAEGYGILNVDAAIEALTVDLALPTSGSTSGEAYERRAWGRRVALTAGTPVRLMLATPPTGDFDVYLYGEGTDPAGNPILQAAGDKPGLGISELLEFTPVSNETAMLVVKRISGSGTWSLVPPPVCGNGQREVGEACDDGNTTSGDCCSSACVYEPSGQACPGGTCKSGLCTAPVCGDSVVVLPETCDDGNTLEGDCCTGACQVVADGVDCSGGSCIAGKCTPPIVSDAVPGGIAAQQVAPTACGCSGVESGLGALLVCLGALVRRGRREKHRSAD